MAYVELAIDKHGEPFAVSDDVTDWRLCRRGPRGRPAVVKARGHAVSVPRHASPDDVVAAAGPGYYHAIAVDAQGCAVKGLPVACLGELTENDAIEVDEDGDTYGDEPAPAAERHATAALSEALCRSVEANSRVMEQTVGQLSSLVTSLASLVQSTHELRAAQPPIAPAAPPWPAVPAPATPPPAPLPAARDDGDTGDDFDGEDDDDEIDPQDGELEPIEMVPVVEPQVLQLPPIIEMILHKVVEIVIAKVTSSSGIGGLPWDAVADWSKAVAYRTPEATARSARPPAAPAMWGHPASAPAPTSSGPVGDASVATGTAGATASVPTSVSTGDVAAPLGSWASASAYPAPAAVPATEVPTMATVAPAPHAAMPPTAEVPLASAGVAPSSPMPLGAAPASMVPTPATPRNDAELAAMVNGHMLEIWRGLSPPERARATAIMSRFTPQERTAWLAELAALPVPDAIARARAYLHATSPPAATSPSPTLPTVPAPGETS